MPKWLPIDTKLASVPCNRAQACRRYPLLELHGPSPVKSEEIKQWAILDTFDALAPKYDKPQTFDEVRGWFQQAGLSNVRVERGSNGIVGNATKPNSAQLGIVANSHVRMTA